MAKAKDAVSPTEMVAQDRTMPLAPISLSELGTILAKSGFFGDAKSTVQAMVKVLAGKELGVGPITAMTGINIIQGHVSLSANLIGSCIRCSRKYDYSVLELTTEKCVLEFFRDGKSLGKSEFGGQEAVRTGAAAGKNAHSYKKFPQNMFFARAMSNGAKWYCPDVFGGPVYTPDELDCTISETGEIIEPPPDARKKSFAEIQAELAAGTPTPEPIDVAPNPPIAADLEIDRLNAKAAEELAVADARAKELAAKAPPESIQPAAAVVPAAVAATTADPVIQPTVVPAERFKQCILALGYKTDLVFQGNVKRGLEFCRVAKFSDLNGGDQVKMLGWLQALVDCQALATELGYTPEKLGPWLKGKTGVERIAHLEESAARSLLMALQAKKVAANPLPQ